MELLTICITVIVDISDTKIYFYKKKEGHPMGGSLSPTLANILMNHFEINTLKLISKFET